MKDPTLRSSLLPSSCQTRGQHANIVKTLYSCSNVTLVLSRYSGGNVFDHWSFKPGSLSSTTPLLFVKNKLCIYLMLNEPLYCARWIPCGCFLLLQDSPEVWIWQVPRRQLRGVGSGTLWRHWCQGAMGTGFPGCEWTKFIYLISDVFYLSYLINFNVSALASASTQDRYKCCNYNIWCLMLSTYLALIPFTASFGFSFPLFF